MSLSVQLKDFADKDDATTVTSTDSKMLAITPERDENALLESALT